MDDNGKILNKKYKEDVARTLKYTRWYLWALGMWPLVNPDPNKFKMFSIFWIPTTLLLSLFIVVPTTIHTIYIEEDLPTQLIMGGPIGFASANIIKIFAMVFHHKTFKKCFQHLCYDWRVVESDDHRKMMFRNTAIGDHLSSLCAIFMYSSGFSFNAVMPLLKGNVINEFNVTVRPLNYPGYDLFYDSNRSPFYEFTYIGICVAAFLLLSVTTCTCNLAAVFVTHICGQIDIMMSRLDHFFDDNDGTDATTIKRIGVIVHSHNRVLRLTAMVETALSEICFAEVTSSIIIICLVEYSLLLTLAQTDFVTIGTYMGLLASLIFNVGIFCVISELLTNQCAQISDVAYMMDWYRLPGKTALGLVIIIAMADCPRKLTAGGMIDLSIYSFGSLIKSTVVYLNMLRTMA